MIRISRFFVMLCALLLIPSLIASAQTEIDGTLVLGQPTVGNLSAEKLVLNFAYTLASDAQVVIEAFGEQVAPSITILRAGEVAAQAPNADATLTLSLAAFLPAGDYTVQVSAANGAAGLVVVVVADEASISAEPLAVGVPVSGTVSAERSIAFYSFDALSNPAYLYISGRQPDLSGEIRVVNVATGATSALIGAVISDARLQIAPTGGSYRVEVTHGGAAAESFSLCLIEVGAAGCDSQAVAEPTLAVTPPLEATTVTSACTVTPVNAGGANIRQSASVNAVIVGALPGGASALVNGLSPDGSFFQVNYNGVIGWMAGSAVTPNGACANLPVVAPPPIIPAATAVPTQAPTQPPPPTPSGPCLIRITGPVNVYQTPNAVIDELQDQVQAGYELIPVGRLADNSWWRTNYMGAWIQTSTFGNGATVSGDCSMLPVVSP